MQGEVEKYYDEFSDVFMRDITGGNPRVHAVHELYELSIPLQTKSILLVGCGSGRDAWELAERVAPNASILAVDISGNNVRIAEALFAHARVVFKQADITEDVLDGRWQYIVFPDVYEHIPIDRRKSLHALLSRYLTTDGRILLTCPTVWHQESLRASGQGLQIVDEDVDLTDVIKLADDIGGFVSLYRTVSIWRSNDYFHAIVERGIGSHELSPNESVFFKGQAPRGYMRRFFDGVLTHTKLRSLHHRFRRYRYMRKLRNAGLLASENRLDA